MKQDEKPEGVVVDPPRERQEGRISLALEELESRVAPNALWAD
jgi:hypothetical protein